MNASRERFARPRREVEMALARDNGFMTDEELAAVDRLLERRPALAGREVQIVNRLMRHGVGEDVAADIVGRHGADAVARQLAYFAFRRNLKHPARALVASIEEAWEPPPAYPRADQ